MARGIMEKTLRIAVIGAGLMGHGIAQEFAVAGFSVSLQDISEETSSAAARRIQENLSLLASQGRVPESAIAPALSRIQTTTSLAEAVSAADLVIEAVSEDLPLKLRLFREMDALCPPHTILASNTSTFKPSLLAAATQRPDKVVIVHYFNPPYLIPLVEVVPSPHTSPETTATAMELLARIGKRPVEIRGESPGFVANRLQAALIREAFAIVQSGVATPQEVDAVVRYGIGRRLAVAGPFEIGDSAGWDVWNAVAGQLIPTLSNAVETPALMRERAEKGELGVKSGKGFYERSAEEIAAFRRRMASALLEMSDWDEESRR